MIVTNTTGQTDIIHRHTERVSNGSHKELEDDEFSVTQVLKDATAILLGKRHRNEIKRDVQQLARTVDGTDRHEALRPDAEALGYLCEQELSMNVKYGDGDYFKLYGKIDFYHPIGLRLIDKKYTKQATYQRNAEGKDDEWQRQLTLYAMMMEATKPSWYKGLNEVQIQATLDDVSVVSNDKKGESTDIRRMIEYTVPTMDEMADSLRDAIAKVKEVRALVPVPDSFLPPCSEKYRYIDVKFKIYKRKSKNSEEHGKSAVAGHANYQSYEDAREGFEKAGMTDDWYVIEKTGSEPIKCLYYCDVCEFCPYWKSLKKEKANETVEG